MIKSSVLIFMLIFLTSCKVYHISPMENREFPISEPKRNAFVVNHELSKEYKILKNAGIYNLVNDSLFADVVKIQLFPLDKNLACGNGAFITVLTAGQLPVRYSDRYIYRFVEILENTNIERQFELQVATSVWFWNVFSSHKNFNQEAGKALLSSYYSNSSSSAMQ